MWGRRGRDEAVKEGQWKSAITTAIAEAPVGEIGSKRSGWRRAVETIDNISELKRSSVI